MIQPLVDAVFAQAKEVVEVQVPAPTKGGLLAIFDDQHGN